jgi:hypothetical protein
MCFKWSSMVFLVKILLHDGHCAKLCANFLFGQLLSLEKSKEFKKDAIKNIGFKSGLSRVKYQKCDVLYVST